MALFHGALWHAEARCIAMNAEPELPNGTVLGNYRILGTLGEGGMGRVYSAEHTGLGKRVAIKTLRRELALDEQVRARFLREGRAAAAVRHPHVVDVHDVGVHGEVPYLVMELLEGQDLGAHVAHKGRMNATQVADVLLPVLTAMAEAHRAGIVHRDLKPENIFLARGPGASFVPKVLDFGISKLRETSSMNLTGSNTLLGTPYYMAPEQASSAKDVDARADLYSLGVILYHCITGNVPFTGTSLVQLIGQILHASPPPLHESVPDVPSPLEQIVARAMAKDPAKRYQSAEELARALLPFASERTRLNYKDELAASGNAGFGSYPPGVPGDKQASTLDPTANSIVIEGVSRGPRNAMIAIGALVVLGGGALALRASMHGDDANAPPVMPAPPAAAAPAPAAASAASPMPSKATLPAPAPAEASAAMAPDAGRAPEPAASHGLEGKATASTHAHSLHAHATQRPSHAAETHAPAAPEQAPAKPAASVDPFSERK